MYGVFILWQGATMRLLQGFSVCHLTNRTRSQP